ncbi:NAD-dependent epimerase/dehydratase family protein [Polaribacter aquimarinus]|uniref:NAD-dependent epimerase/dehydratase family protein n=1 Tax=Polaribacter aquimarinus TaxID=2100726 RepID=UPI0015E81BFC|nr:NAD-dependent epimerase/dehydratase family protein [Polaribacter aquimarinus]
MNLLITGANGFIGRNIINKISITDEYNLFFISRFNDSIYPYTPDKIDFTLHLSSVHRAIPESLIYDENIKINQHLIDVLNNHNLKSNILFTSSIHENKDTFYGRSKRKSSSTLQYTCKDWGTKFVKIVFPNIFGPFAKPNHTSVVANFCSDIIYGKKSFINDVDLNLLYVDFAVEAILNFKSKEEFTTHKVNLLDLHKKLKNYYNLYKDEKPIVLNSKFDFQLFTTLKSYLNE